MLLALAFAYVASGIVIRIGGIVRRRSAGACHAPAPADDRIALIGSESLLGREIRDLAADIRRPLSISA